MIAPSLRPYRHHGIIVHSEPAFRRVELHLHFPHMNASMPAIHSSICGSVPVLAGCATCARPGANAT